METERAVPHICPLDRIVVLQVNISRSIISCISLEYSGGGGGGWFSNFFPGGFGGFGGLGGTPGAGDARRRPPPAGFRDDFTYFGNTGAGTKSIEL